MIYALLWMFPIAIAAMCFALRKQYTLASLIALLTTLVEGALVVLTPTDLPARFLGVNLLAVPMTRMFLLAVCLTLAVAFLTSTQLPHGENFPAIGLLTLGLVAAILVTQDPFVTTLLLLASGLTVVLAIVDLPPGDTGLVAVTSIATGLRYLSLVLLSGIVMALAFVLVDVSRTMPAVSTFMPRLILALLLISFGMRLAALPFHTWLADLFDEATPLVSLLVVGVINIAALLLLVVSLQYIPETLLNNERGPTQVRVFGLVTAGGAALLALRQPTLRRFVAFLLIYDTGVILSAIVTNPTGLTGALFEMFNQMLLAALLVLSVSLLERTDGRAVPEGEGLLRRRPIASATFIGAALGIMGLPPLSSFPSRLLIYQGLAQVSPGYVVALLVSSACIGVALAALLRTHFLGRALQVEVQDDLRRDMMLPLPPEPQREPPLLTGVALALLLLLLALGLYPQPLLSPIVEAVRGLTFSQNL